MRLRTVICVSCILIAGQFFIDRSNADDGVSLNAKWKDGLKFESEDKSVQVQIGGEDSE